MICNRARAWVFTAVFIAVLAVPSAASANVPSALDPVDIVADLARALFATLVLELLVAAMFRIGWKGLLGVAAVNLVTNPLLNLVRIGLGLVAHGIVFGLGGIYLLFALEALVILVEWRFLSTLLRADDAMTLRIAKMVIVMNFISLFGGNQLLRALGAIWIGFAPVLT